MKPLEEDEWRATWDIQTGTVNHARYYCRCTPTLFLSGWCLYFSDLSRSLQLRICTPSPHLPPSTTANYR